MYFLKTKDTANKLFDRIDRFLAMAEKLNQKFTAMEKDIKRIKGVIKEKLEVDLLLKLQRIIKYYALGNLQGLRPCFLIFIVILGATWYI